MMSFHSKKFHGLNPIAFVRHVDAVESRVENLSACLQRQCVMMANVQEKAESNERSGDVEEWIHSLTETKCIAKAIQMNLHLRDSEARKLEELWKIQVSEEFQEELKKDEEDSHEFQRELNKMEEEIIAKRKVHELIRAGDIPGMKSHVLCNGCAVRTCEGFEEDGDLVAIIQSVTYRGCWWVYHAQSGELELLEECIIEPIFP